VRRNAHSALLVEGPKTINWLYDRQVVFDDNSDRQPDMSTYGVSTTAACNSAQTSQTNAANWSFVIGSSLSCGENYNYVVKPSGSGYISFLFCLMFSECVAAIWELFVDDDEQKQK
jgi:hypothetical protein